MPLYSLTTPRISVGVERHASQHSTAQHSICMILHRRMIPALLPAPSKCMRLVAASAVRALLHLGLKAVAHNERMALVAAGACAAAPLFESSSFKALSLLCLEVYLFLCWRCGRALCLYAAIWFLCWWCSSRVSMCASFCGGGAAIVPGCVLLSMVLVQQSRAPAPAPTQPASGAFSHGNVSTKLGVLFNDTHTCVHVFDAAHGKGMMMDVYLLLNEEVVRWHAIHASTFAWVRTFAGGLELSLPPGGLMQHARMYVCVYVCARARSQVFWADALCLSLRHDQMP
eukprot:scaffold271221_cov19-Tisochrysis_lutea.AAC.2